MAMNCLLNWKKVRLLKEWGVLNVEAQNKALLIKWRWKLESDRDEIFTLIHGTRNI
jgi:hypothetical protein